MESIPTLFVRNDRGRVTFPATINPECQWVADGEGVATVKWDGTACAVIDGVLYARHRHEASKGDPPPGWIHHSRDLSQQSGHGWLAVDGRNPSHRWHCEAAWRSEDRPPPDGTYELIGPKVQGNPYHLSAHALRRHGDVVVDAPRDAEGLMKFLVDFGHEGIVFHHPDGRMAKVKCRDFGLGWKT